MPLQDARPKLDDSTDEHPAAPERDPPRVRIRFGALTDTGKVRVTNEDHFLVAELSKSMQVYKTSLQGRDRFREGILEQLTSDHTLIQTWIDGGTISTEDAKRHKWRNVVTNVVGGDREGVYAEVHKLAVLDGDTLLFCTDGLTEPVSDDAIAEALRHHPDPEEACAHLVDLALRGGGPDNVTAVIARYQVDQNPS